MPQKGKQELAFNTDADVIIYGGSAGCCPATTEYLTNSGWKRFDQYKEGEHVAVYSPLTDSLEFTDEVEHIKLQCDSMERLTGKDLQLTLSDEHKVLYWDNKNGRHQTVSWKTVLDEYVESKKDGWSGKIRTAFTSLRNNKEIPLSEGELRLQVAVNACGVIVKNGKDNYAQTRFSKERHYLRLLDLCKRFNIKHKDFGSKFSTEFQSQKEYEVIVWPTLSEKRFTELYYKASEEQLSIIFDELRHWGESLISIDQDNTSFRYSSEYKSDCDFIQYVFCSQGMNTAIIEDTKNIKPKWTTEGCLSGSGFRSFENNGKKSLISSVKTPDGFKYCFSTKTGFFIARENGKIFLTGNSGKSRLILLRAGYHAHKDPNFEAVLFRRTSPPLKAAGGLFSEAKKLYTALKPKIREKDMEIIFNSTNGGNLKFTHLEHVSDAEGNHQGLQYSAVFFDELTHFEQEQFLYLLGRLRSSAKGNSYCMATTNPDMDSWVLNWVRWYLDENGKFDESKLGIKRYFVTVDNQPVFAETEQELVDDYPDLCWQDDGTGNTVFVPPMSFIFIGGTIFDNPALIRSNPKYLSALKAQTTVNRKRLLDGCWYAREEGCNYFQREWLHKLDKVPINDLMSVRAWDLASAEPSEKNMKPDWTASIKMLKLKNGDVVMVGDYDKSSLDTKTNISGRFRKRTGERDRLMLDQAKHDGVDTYIVIPKDPAAAGALAFSEMNKFFTKNGFIVKQDPAPSNKSKLKKFEPFSTAAQNGLIYIVESTFTKETLNAFYADLESFDGERSTADRKDDWPDATASAYNALTKTKVFSNYAMPKVNAKTRYSVAMHQ